MTHDLLTGESKKKNSQEDILTVVNVFCYGKKPKIHRCTCIDLINMSILLINKVKAHVFISASTIICEIHITLIHGSCSSKSSVLEKYIASINSKQVDFYFHRHYIISDQSEKRTSPSSSYVLYR